MAPPVITAILTVFNKADVLGPVLARLEQEAGDLLGEVIALDDASTDGSREVLATAARWPALRLMHDGRNRGPSIRLNEGAAAAAGEWLLLVDADGVLRHGALAGLYRLALQHGLDAVHATVERVTDLAAGDALGPFPPAPSLHIADDPRRAVLSRRGIVRMAWLVRRDCFLRAGGADPGVFVQDESLPLRLAGAARRIGLCPLPAVIEPAAGFNLSGNPRQLHHDRFMAHYRYLKQPMTSLPSPLRRLVIDRCLASARRAGRSGLLPGHSTLLLHARRLALRLGLPLDAESCLDALAATLAAQPGLRRPEGSG